MTESLPVALAREVGSALLKRGWRLVSAESCTGGLLAATMTEITGSSEWFEGAFVTYRLSAKTAMVGVSEEMLGRHGAVSEPVARAMAEGALTHSDGDIAVSITGIAGPDGGDLVSPVGTIWFGWALREGAGIQCVQTAEHHLSGSRQAVRSEAVSVALEGVLALCRPA